MRRGTRRAFSPGSRWGGARVRSFSRRLRLSAGPAKARDAPSAEPASIAPTREKIGLHSALSFHVDLPAVFEQEGALQPFVRLLRYLNGAGFAVGFHAAGRIHGVSPHVVDEFFL